MSRFYYLNNVILLGFKIKPELIKNNISTIFEKENN